MEDNVTGPGVGGTLIFSYTYVGWGHYFGFEFCISIFLGVFNKKKIGGGGGGGMKILWIFFWGHHKNGLYLGVISMHFRVFS